jgi:hypothetical protein
MCEVCQRPALGSVYCAEHLPVTAAPPRTPPPPPSLQSPYTAPGPPVADPGVHPALALLLGFAPGVGALYNGQYAKGLIHALVFGLMVSVENNTSNAGVEALVGIMIATWIIYQAFEAYHTARKRRYGIAVEEFSSLFDLRTNHSRFPAGALVLIALGFVLLLDTTGILSMEVLLKYCPALLIFAGIYLLYSRTHRPASLPAANPAANYGVPPTDGSFRQ